MKIYCVKCKQITDTIDMIQSISKNKRFIIKGKCLLCQCIKCKFLKKTEYSIFPFKH